MSIGQSLSRLVLKRLVDDVFSTGGAEGLDAVLDFLTRCGQQDGGRLTAVLEQALECAWRAAEVALADDPLWKQGCAGLAPGDARAFRQRLEMILTKLVRGGANLRRPGATAVELALRRQCLRELRAVREAGAWRTDSTPTNGRTLTKSSSASPSRRIAASVAPKAS